MRTLSLWLFVVGCGGSTEPPPRSLVLGEMGVLWEASAEPAEEEALEASATDEEAVVSDYLSPDEDPTFESDRRRGVDEAHANIASASVRFLTYGYPSNSRGFAEELLASRFGVTLDVVAGCVVDSGLIAYVGAYNEVVAGWISSTYGSTALEDLWNEAEEKSQSAWGP